MQLGFSSEAAPRASFDVLLEAAVRRGFAALELREGDGHGVILEGGAFDATLAGARAAAAGVGLAGYRVCGPADPVRLSRLSLELAAPVLVDGSENIEQRVDRARAISAAGGTAVVVVRGSSAPDDAHLVHEAGLDLAWDADPAAGGLDATAETLLEHCCRTLRHIRLIGGGPEVTMQEGKGIGSLMRLLALRSYDGTLVMSPSSPRYRMAWEHWLCGRGGCGCGSSASTGLPLAEATAVGGG